MAENIYQKALEKGKKSKLRRAKSYSDPVNKSTPVAKTKKKTVKKAVKKKVVKKKAAKKVAKKAVKKVVKKTTPKKVATPKANVKESELLDSMVVEQPTQILQSNQVNQIESPPQVSVPTEVVVESHPESVTQEAVAADTLKPAEKLKVADDVEAIIEDHDFSLDEYFEKEEELPAYVETNVTLIPRDPHCMFAFWEITGERVEQMKSELGSMADNCVYTLRVYDVTYKDFDGHNANEWFDLDRLHMNSRYLDMKDGTTYCAEIGVRLSSGEFYPFARSNFISTPPAGVSPRNELMWTDIHIDNEVAPTEAFIKLKKDQLKKLSLYRNSYQINGNRITLSRTDIVEYYRSGRPLIDLIRQRMRSADDIAGDTYMPDDDGLYIEDAAITEITESAYLSSSPVGSSAGFSGEMIRSKKSEKFRFKLETELIVRGETVPGSSVYWGGKKIEINDDGTFEFRMDLHDGLIPLEFTAMSKSEALGKTIKTSAIRTKTTTDIHTNKDKL